MKRTRRSSPFVQAPSAFSGFRFPPEVILLAVRWYLRYSLSYRDLEELLGERGVAVDHVTLYRWVQRFTPMLMDAARPCRHSVGDRWFVDETYVKVNGIWRYVYRVVDQHGQVIDVYVSNRRDISAAEWFFRTSLSAHGQPVEVVTDKAPTLAPGHRRAHPGRVSQHRAVREHPVRNRRRTAEIPAAANDGREAEPDRERRHPRPHLRPEHPARPLRTRRRRAIGVPAGDRLRRTTTGDLIDTATANDPACPVSAQSNSAAEAMSAVLKVHTQPLPERPALNRIRRLERVTFLHAACRGGRLAPSRRRLYCAYRGRLDDRCGRIHPVALLARPTRTMHDSRRPDFPWG